MSVVLNHKEIRAELKNPNTRDCRIDFFRGVALLCIFVDHIPGNFVSRLTLHNMGFSDAAELFVLLAGVSSAMAYGKRVDSGHLIARRLGRIYLAHVSLVFLVAGLLAGVAAAIGQTALLEDPTLAPFLSNFGGAVLNTLRLTLQPQYIDILPLYLMLLLWLPVFLRLARYDRTLALVIACGIWFCAGALQLNIAGSRDGGWYFNPFAWQFIFSIGVVIGLRSDPGSITRLPRSHIVLGLAIAFLAFSFLLAAPWSHLPIGAFRNMRLLPPDLVGYVSKTYASSWRIVHVLSLAYVTAWVVPSTSSWLHSWWAVAICNIGRRALTMFVLASISSYMASIVFVVYGRTLLVQLVCNAVGVLLFVLVGNAQSLYNQRFMLATGGNNPGTRCSRFDA